MHFILFYISFDTIQCEILYVEYELEENFKCNVYAVSYQ